MPDSIRIDRADYANPQHAAALVNVHDLAVLPAYRGRRIAERLLAEVEALARARGACKLTLEVLSGNATAMRLYARAGFLQKSLG